MLLYLAFEPVLVVETCRQVQHPLHRSDRLLWPAALMIGPGEQHRCKRLIVVVDVSMKELEDLGDTFRQTIHAAFEKIDYAYAKTGSIQSKFVLKLLPCLDQPLKQCPCLDRITAEQI